MGNNRATKAEKAKRIEETARLIASRHTTTQIKNHLNIKYGLSERQVDNYIADARKIIRESLSPKGAREILQEAILSRKVAIQEAYKPKEETRITIDREGNVLQTITTEAGPDYGLAFKLEKDLANLLGLYPGQKDGEELERMAAFATMPNDKELEKEREVIKTKEKADASRRDSLVSEIDRLIEKYEK